MLKSNICQFQQISNSREHKVMHQQVEGMHDMQQIQQVNEKLCEMKRKQIYDKHIHLAISSKTAQKVIATELSEKEEEDPVLSAVLGDTTKRSGLPSTMLGQRQVGDLQKDKYEAADDGDGEPALLQSLKRVVLSTGGGRQTFSSAQIEAYKQELLQCLHQQKAEQQVDHHRLVDCDISEIARSSEYDFKQSIKMYDNTKDFEEEEKYNYPWNNHSNGKTIGQQRISNNLISQWNTQAQDQQAGEYLIQNNSGQLKSREILEGFGQQQPLKGDLSISCLANTVEDTDRTIDLKGKNEMISRRGNSSQRCSDQIIKEDAVQSQVNQIMQPLKQLFSAKKEQSIEELNNQESFSYGQRNNRFKYSDSSLLLSAKQETQEVPPRVKVISVLNEECVPNPIQKIRRISGSTNRNERNIQSQVEREDQQQSGVSSRQGSEGKIVLQQLAKKHYECQLQDHNPNQPIPQERIQYNHANPKLFSHLARKCSQHSQILSSSISNTDNRFEYNYIVHPADNLHQMAHISSKPPIETPTYMMPICANSNQPNSELMLLQTSHPPAVGYLLSRRNSLKEQLQQNTFVKLRISHQSESSQSSPRITQANKNEQRQYFDGQYSQKVQETATQQVSLQNSIPAFKLADGHSMQMKIIKGIRKSRESSLSLEGTSVKPQHSNHINPSAIESINQIKFARERLCSEKPLHMQQQATPMKQVQENDIDGLELSQPELTQVVQRVEGALSGRVSEKQWKVESGYKRSDLKLNDSIDFSKENTSKQVKGGRDLNPTVLPSSTDSQEKLLAIILKTNQTKLLSKADSSSQIQKMNETSQLFREGEVSRITDPSKQTYLLDIIDASRNRSQNSKATLHFQYDGGLESKTNWNNKINNKELDTIEYFSLSGVNQIGLKGQDEHTEVSQQCLESSQLQKDNIQPSISIGAKCQIKEQIEQQLSQEAEQKQQQQESFEIKEQQQQFNSKEYHQQQLQLSLSPTTEQPQNNSQESGIQEAPQNLVHVPNQHSNSSQSILEPIPVANSSRASNGENDQIDHTNQNNSNVSTEQKTIARSLQVLQEQEINVQISFDMPIVSDKSSRPMLLSQDKQQSSTLAQTRPLNGNLACSNSQQNKNKYANENENPLDFSQKRSSTNSKYNQLQNHQQQSHNLTARRNSINDVFGITSRKCSLERKASTNVSSRPSVSQINYIEVFQKRLAGSSSSQKLGQIHNQNMTSILVESQKQQGLVKTKEIAADSRNKSINSQHISSSSQLNISKVKDKVENRKEEDNHSNHQLSQLVQSFSEQNRVYRPLLDIIKKGSCNASMQEQLQNRIWSSSNRSMHLK